ncbi:hypothetical protein PBY51_004194 [Eleginops maclovinus]|uniref:Uncharacterized protein n=1 Tax=Eleginops maclovinus TaxID=56733 RepID=A0AAN7Y2C4_ELEMC|nr:hypothetical protein PBY51_004194 [Eleginops maclovinus]
MSAARLVHTSSNQRARLLGQREAADCKLVLFPSSTPILFWVWGREGRMADLIVEATDPAPHPEETEEKNNEQQSQSWRPANAGGVGRPGPSVCNPAARTLFSLPNAVVAHCRFTCSTFHLLPLFTMLPSFPFTLA